VPLLLLLLPPPPPLLLLLLLLLLPLLPCAAVLLMMGTAKAVSTPKVSFCSMSSPLMSLLLCTAPLAAAAATRRVDSWCLLVKALARCTSMMCCTCSPLGLLLEATRGVGV